jgi:hypothetical protein
MTPWHHWCDLVLHAVTACRHRQRHSSKETSDSSACVCTVTAPSCPLSVAHVFWRSVALHSSTHPCQALCVQPLLRSSPSQVCWTSPGPGRPPWAQAGRLRDKQPASSNTHSAVPTHTKIHMAPPGWWDGIALSYTPCEFCLSLILHAHQGRSLLPTGDCQCRSSPLRVNSSVKQRSHLAASMAVPLSHH